MIVTYYILAIIFGLITLSLLIQYVLTGINATQFAVLTVATIISAVTIGMIVDYDQPQLGQAESIVTPQVKPQPPCPTAPLCAKGN